MVTNQDTPAVILNALTTCGGGSYWRQLTPANQAAATRDPLGFLLSHPSLFLTTGFDSSTCAGTFSIALPIQGFPMPTNPAAGAGGLWFAAIGSGYYYTLASADQQAFRNDPVGFINTHVNVYTTYPQWFALGVSTTTTPVITTQPPGGTIILTGPFGSQATQNIAFTISALVQDRLGAPVANALVQLFRSGTPTQAPSPTGATGMTSFNVTESVVGSVSYTAAVGTIQSSPLTISIIQGITTSPPTTTPSITTTPLITTPFLTTTPGITTPFATLPAPTGCPNPNDWSVFGFCMPPWLLVGAGATALAVGIFAVRAIKVPKVRIGGR